MGRKGVNKASTDRELAAKLGISHVLVNRKRHQGKSDTQIAQEAALWLKKTESRKALKPEPVHTGDEGLESYGDAQARKERALATLREMEIAEKQGILINADEVKTVWAAHISACKSKLLSMADELSDKLAAEANPVRCRDLILEKVRSALTALSADA